MATSIPAAVTLAIKAGDTINIKGQRYTITSVAAGVDNGQGDINYAVTTSQGVITVNSNNCVISEPTAGVSTGAGSMVDWVQSANA